MFSLVLYLPYACFVYCKLLQNVCHCGRNIFQEGISDLNLTRFSFCEQFFVFILLFHSFFVDKILHLSASLCSNASPEGNIKCFHIHLGFGLEEIMYTKKRVKRMVGTSFYSFKSEFICTEFAKK
jgi:hypothetical protein